MWGQSYGLSKSKKGGKLEEKIVNLYMGRKWEEASEMGGRAFARCGDRSLRLWCLVQPLGLTTVPRVSVCIYVPVPAETRPGPLHTTAHTHILLTHTDCTASASESSFFLSPVSPRTHTHTHLTKSKDISFLLMVS